MRFLVTAGPTREYVDSVRFISNSSSGKMGYAIALEAAARGHEVFLVSGPVDLPDPPGVRVVRVVSSAEMFEAAVGFFAQCDAAIMAAAVSDFRPRNPSARKIAKRDAPLSIELEPTEDICAHLGNQKRSRIVIGFAMEDHDHHGHAEAKLRRKNCDAIVLNKVANLAADRGEIQILTANRPWAEPLSGTKGQLAQGVVDFVEELLRRRNVSGL